MDFEVGQCYVVTLEHSAECDDIIEITETHDSGVCFYNTVQHAHSDDTEDYTNITRRFESDSCFADSLRLIPAAIPVPAEETEQTVDIKVGQRYVVDIVGFEKGDIIVITEQRSDVMYLYSTVQQHPDNIGEAIHTNCSFGKNSSFAKSLRPVLDEPEETAYLYTNFDDLFNGNQHA